jgi:hypothetical protein
LPETWELHYHTPQQPAAAADHLVAVAVVEVAAGGKDTCASIKNKFTIFVLSLFSSHCCSITSEQVINA